MRGEQVECTPHAAEHAQAEDIDFHEAQCVDVILVPLDHLAIGHRCRFDRYQVVQPILCQNETAGMLGHMPGKADQNPRQIQCQAQATILQVEVQCLDVLLTDAVIAPTPDLGGKRTNDVLGQAKRLAHVAHRATGAIADDRGAECGAVVPIRDIDPLDHVFPSLMLEVHVDVGRFLAHVTDETFE